MSYVVLIVDDDFLILKNTKRILESEGFVCEVAKNGEEAVEKIKEKNYDLILLDISMPKKNGNQVLCETRKAGIKTPVFMLTGNIEENSYKLCMEAGANEYITKPYNFDNLVSKINEYKGISAS